LEIGALKLTTRVKTTLITDRIIARYWKP